MSGSVILTSDRGSFSDYSGNSALGYVACMPARLVPRTLMNRFFTPSMKAYDNGESILAPYALRKVEASLLSNGINDVLVVPPERLESVVDAETSVVGITVHDPYGFSPVSTKLTMLFGGGDAWNTVFFRELAEKIAGLKRKYNFKVLAGGPGVWQFSMKRPDFVDTVFNGEAELDIPQVVRGLMDGSSTPRIASGRNPKVEEIPCIVKPSRFGEVQITRGCPRGCQFCSITPETFRSIPMEDILKEERLNLANGMTSTDLVTDDVLLYGSKKLRTNHDAVVELFRKVRDAGMEQIYFPHISAPAVRESPDTVLDMANEAEYHKYRGEAPVVGLESGSTRILEKYMRGKAFPWEPKDWRDIIIDAAGIMNDGHITPVYTMTIGFEDETDDDVQESIDLVNSIIDSGVNTWIFPLPVIPITTTRIKGNTFPEIERLPEKYWELLYVSWKHDIDTTKEMLPYLSQRMENPIIKTLVGMLGDRAFGNLENTFRKFMETKGRKALDYSDINLTGPLGLLRSAFMITKASLSRTISSRRNGRAIPAD